MRADQVATRDGVSTAFPPRSAAEHITGRAPAPVPRGSFPPDVPLFARHPVLLVLLVASGVRLVALAAAADAIPLLDERTYTQRAHALLDGRGFLGSYQSWVRHPTGMLSELPQYPGAWQPPGQTVLMAGVMALSGRSVLAVKLVQVVLSTLSVALVYALGRAWFGARAGLAAAWLAALYPNLIAFSHYLWSETLFVFWLLLALVALTRSREEPPGVGDAVLGGVALGLGALTRGTLFLFLPVLAAWLVWAHRRRWRLALGRAALAVAVATLLIVPWSVRNTALHGGFVWIDTNAPYNLWRGNGPDTFAHRNDPSTARYRWPLSGIPIAPVDNRTGRRLVDEARRALGTDTPTDLEIIGHARDAAWASIRSDPATFLRRVPIRLVDLWNPSSFLVRHVGVGAYGAVPAGLAALLVWAAILSYLVVVALAAAGAWLARRRPETWLVLGFAATVSGISAVAFGLTRFRLPVVPLLMVLAGLALARWLERGRAGRGAVATAAALVALVGLGCERRDAAPPGGRAAELPNVVVITLDTTRADHLGLYGYFRDTSPVLDELAREALVFDRAIAPMATTLPTHVSLFTATSPLEHGVLANTTQGGERFVPSPGLRSFAEVARDAGYATAAFVSATPLKRGSGVESGFDVFDQPDGKHRRGDATADRALAWLDEARRPFLLWVHLYDAHWPYAPPPPFDARYRTDEGLERWLATRKIPDRSYRPLVQQWEEARPATNAYDGELRFQDAQLGRLLRALDARPDGERTALLVMGDHGEGLSQHGHPAHGGTWHEQLRVPLLIRAPGVAPGRVSALVSVLDALPTLIGLLGVPELEGLLAQATGLDALAEDFVERPVLSQDTGRSNRTDPFRYSLTGPRYKYFRTEDAPDGEELYDLHEDPFELSDVASVRGDVLREMRRLMTAQIEARSRRGRELRGDAATTTGPADPEIVEQLRALGYLEPAEDETAP